MVKNPKKKIRFFSVLSYGITLLTIHLYWLYHSSVDKHLNWQYGSSVGHTLILAASRQFWQYPDTGSITLLAVSWQCWKNTYTGSITVVLAIHLYWLHHVQCWQYRYTGSITVVLEIHLYWQYHSNVGNTLILAVSQQCLKQTFTGSIKVLAIHYYTCTGTLHSKLYAPHSTLYTLRSTLFTLGNTCFNLHVTLN